MTTYFKWLEWIAWTENARQHSLETCTTFFQMFQDVFYHKTAGSAQFIRLANRVLHGE